MFSIAPKMTLILPITFAVALIATVSANTVGAGSCEAGIAAIGGTHLDFGPSSPSKREGGIGTLFEGATYVEVEGVTLTAGTPTTFPVNTDLTWTVTAEQVPLKGIFVRVQAAADNAFTNVGVSDGLQNEPFCDALADNVIGVSHTSAAMKSQSSGVINFSLKGSVTMDISVVYDDTQFAISAFSSYPLTIGEATPTAPTAPTPVAPVPVAQTPTAFPTFSPVEVPVGSPTLAPTDTPAPAPTDNPVPAPVEPPSESPTPTNECGKDKGGKKCMGGMIGKEGMKMGGKEGMAKGGKEGMAKGEKGGMMTADKAPPETGSKGQGGMGKTKGESRRYLK
jgi:hypothetical protein